MLQDTVSWLAANKDAISTLETILTIMAIIVGGIWALRRIYFERPYAGALEVAVSGSTVSRTADAHLVHISVKAKNIGKASIEIGNPPDDPHHSTIRIFGFARTARLVSGRPGGEPATIREALTAIPYSTVLVDRDFVDQFEPWFVDRRFTILEAGESETYSMVVALDKNIAALLVQVTIYETRIDRGLGRPFYWREHALIDTTWPRSRSGSTAA